MLTVMCAQFFLSRVKGSYLGRTGTFMNERHSGASRYTTCHLPLILQICGLGLTTYWENIGKTLDYPQAHFA